MAIDVRLDGLTLAVSSVRRSMKFYTGGTQVGNGSSGAGCAKESGQLVVTSLDPANAKTPIASVWCANPGGGGSPRLVPGGPPPGPLMKVAK